MPVGPDVPLISKPASSAARAERLAWARSGPDRPVVWPASTAANKGPSPESSEEVDLSETLEFFRRNVTNVPFVDDAWCDLASVD
jgi:hypothetical protein